MDGLHIISLESNSRIKINFDGGDLSSDAGLLFFKEFLFKIGAAGLISRIFKTSDTAWFRVHKDDANPMEAIYQIISAYPLINVRGIVCPFLDSSLAVLGIMNGCKAMGTC